LVHSLDHIAWTNQTFLIWLPVQRISVIFKRLPQGLTNCWIFIQNNWNTWNYKVFFWMSLPHEAAEIPCQLTQNIVIFSLGDIKWYMRH
jgi:hypothetical protein